MFTKSGLVAAALVGLVAIACQFSLTVESRLFGSLRVHCIAGRVTVDPSDSVPPGTCVKVTFLDGNGNPLGSTETTTGADGVDAPPGTEDIALGPCTPADTNPKKKIKRSGGQRVVVQGDELFAFRQIPFDLEDGLGRWLEFEVAAPDLPAAERLAWSFTKTAFQQPCPAEIRPHGMVETELLGDGRARITLFSNQAPTALDFRWNDAPLFTLADASINAANGWFATTVFVPSALIDTPTVGEPAENRMAFTLGTARGEVGLGMNLELEL